MAAKMKFQRKSLHKPVDKGRPDYYITPTHDFTQYTKDCEEKYWNKETAFDWNQSVPDNLKRHLEGLASEDFLRIAFAVLPMINDVAERKVLQIHEQGLPLEEDALKDIAECIPFDSTTIHQALALQLPLKRLRSSLSKWKDQLEIIRTELLDLTELQRLGIFKDGTEVKHIQSAQQREQQARDVLELRNRKAQVQGEYRRLEQQFEAESTRLKSEIRQQLSLIEKQIKADLEETRTLLERTLQSGNLPDNSRDLARLKDLILKRQLRGLKDIANHALVVEQSAIAPLTMGIIHYKRYREIQEAMTTFIKDEAKHSATFRRFLVEKLEAREYISSKLIKGAQRYMWLGRYMPGAGLFLAVMVEAIGAAYLEFFGEEKYMPDGLFCHICKTISVQDERRHMDLCVAMYNELFRRGRTWERIRNQFALKVMMKSVYGDRTEDHQLIQAFRAFGVESDVLYRHILGRLSAQLARVSMYVQPEKLLEIIGR